MDEATFREQLVAELRTTNALLGNIALALENTNNHLVALSDQVGNANDRLEDVARVAEELKESDKSLVHLYQNVEVVAGHLADLKPELQNLAIQVSRPGFSL